MNQAVQCPACFHVFQAEQRYAGTAVACHQCGTPTLVPSTPRVELIGHAPAGLVENATLRVFNTIGHMIIVGVLWSLLVGGFLLLIAGVSSVLLR